MGLTELLVLLVRSALVLVLLVLLEMLGVLLLVRLEVRALLLIPLVMPMRVAWSVLLRVGAVAQYLVGVHVLRRCKAIPLIQAVIRVVWWHRSRIVIVVYTVITLVISLEFGQVRHIHRVRRE
jgi:hypothetical protein